MNEKMRPHPHLLPSESNSPFSIISFLSVLCCCRTLLLSSAQGDDMTSSWFHPPQWLPVLLCVDCRVSADCFVLFKWAGWPRPFRLAHRKLSVIPQRAQAFEVASLGLWKSPHIVKSAKLILFLSILMQVGMALNIYVCVVHVWSVFCSSGVSIVFGLLFYSILTALGCFQLWFIDKLDLIWT